jgi:hypothetical protein
MYIKLTNAYLSQVIKALTPTLLPPTKAGSTLIVRLMSVSLMACSGAIKVVIKVISKIILELFPGEYQA